MINERIKELVKQSETKEIGYYFFDKEKFAQLIVRECLDIINDEGDWAGGSIRAMKNIKEHFGVEE